MQSQTLTRSLKKLTYRAPILILPDVEGVGSTTSLRLVTGTTGRTRSWRSGMLERVSTAAITAGFETEVPVWRIGRLGGLCRTEPDHALALHSTSTSYGMIIVTVCSPPG
jgi:hypothetical protein